MPGLKQRAEGSITDSRTIVADFRSPNERTVCPIDQNALIPAVGAHFALHPMAALRERANGFIGDP